MVETKEATAAYQGYCIPTIKSGKSGTETTNFQTDYAFHVHFQGKDDWGQVIDFGGNIGYNTAKIKNTVVVERDVVAREYLQKHGRTCTNSLDTIGDQSVDTIYCSHVLEHLENPLEYLQQFAKKLKANGTLILVVPYEILNFGRTTIDINGHLYAWNAITINTLLKRAGFVVSLERYTTLKSISKIMGWNLYSKLTQNTFISKSMMLTRVVINEVTNRREV